MSRPHIDRQGQKKLLVFPGVGSPENLFYSDVYTLIEEGARRFAFDEIRICSWPGQKRTSNDKLTLHGAVSIAKEVIKEAENHSESYSIFCRSFGTIVCAKALNEIAVSGLDRIILWGPPPYSVLWGLFKRDFETTRKKALEKGTRIGGEFFNSITPIETLLPISSLNKKTLIATGTGDKYSPPTFIDYLKSLKDCADIRSAVVQDAEHEVSYKCPEKVREEYLQKLLNENYSKTLLS